jgi:endonuclease YncB( thermonuclease family)
MRFHTAAISSLALLLLLALVQPAAALETVTIRNCYDGDTCRTTDGERIRLACIDTPELRGKRAQPERARAARDQLRTMVVGRSVGLRRITTDRYGRTVGELFVDGMNVQQAMVASRHAEIYWKYASQCPWTR